MKLRLLLVACLAALALPASPAVAAEESIPGTCYETTFPGGGTRSYPCECLVGVPWVTVSPPPPTITVTYCHANLGIGGGGN